MKKRLEFVRLEEKTIYNDDEDFRAKYFLPKCFNKVEVKSNSRLYLILADCYGMPYFFEISKIFKKYTSGRIRTPKLISRISVVLDMKEYWLLEDGCIENLDKIFKEVSKEMGY